MDRCYFSRNPVTHTFFHLLKTLKLGCPILLANCFKENSICFKLIGALPSVVLAMVPDLHFTSGSRSKSISFLIGGPSCRSTRTVNSDTVRWQTPNPSEWGGLSAGRPAGPSIDSYKNPVLEFVHTILSKSRFQQPIIYFWILCRLQYRLIWNRCFTFHILYCAYQGGQWFEYERKEPRDSLITTYATIDPVDAPLTLIFRMWQGECRCWFCQ